MVFARYLKDLDRIDGEPMEFEWKKFQGFTTLGILDEIQKVMTVSKCEPSSVWKSTWPWDSWQTSSVCQKINLLENRREGVNSTLAAHHFFSCTVVAQSCCSPVVIVYSHTLTPCTCTAQVTMHTVCVSPKNTHTSSRNVVHFAALDDTIHGHSFLTFS